MPTPSALCLSESFSSVDCLCSMCKVLSLILGSEEKSADQICCSTLGLFCLVPVISVSLRVFYCTSLFSLKLVLIYFKIECDISSSVLLFSIVLDIKGHLYIHFNLRILKVIYLKNDIGILVTITSINHGL